MAGNFNFRSRGRQEGGKELRSKPTFNLKPRLVTTVSPRVTRRSVEPVGLSPSSRLHGLSAAQADEKARKTVSELNSSHVLHTAEEKAASLVAGTRLQPKSNPHITRLLKDFLRNPSTEFHSRFLSEFVRGPIYVFVSESEMALKESEVRMASMENATQNIPLPKTMSFSPLLFSERDSDKREDGDALMIKRELGTLAPEYAFKSGTRFISIYTSTSSIEEATRHPYMRAAGLDRVSYIGGFVNDFLPWIITEIKNSNGELNVFLNKWTIDEVQLGYDDLKDLSEQVEGMFKHPDSNKLADFTPRLSQSELSNEATESWNTVEDKREEYTSIRRKFLQNRSTQKLDALENKELDLMLAANDREATPQEADPELLPGTDHEMEKTCSDEVKKVLIAVFLQRFEVRSASILTSKGNSDILIGVDSSDLKTTTSKLLTVSETFKESGISFPTMTITSIDKVDGLPIYTRPVNILSMGRVGNNNQPKSLT
eukprot:TRINITY_DN16449_c0_g1_i1.p1 TRINITY_DN16449_c0_g1~~TRINITY_DN16449_c0_g1_i1.p1  ORF type:complete len:505 (+),score=95.32 TRINITY_DN16449_c0_g1_i1:60-1517(+)